MTLVRDDFVVAMERLEKIDVWTDDRSPHTSFMDALRMCIVRVAGVDVGICGHE